MLEDLGARKTVVAVSSAVDQDKLLYPEGSGEHPDPHIWFDVALFATAVDVIAETLSAGAPQYSEYYREQAELLKAELSGLDTYVKSETERIPAGQRVLVTAHDAFNYFGQAYGFEVVGLQGISTAAEAGAADVQALVDLVVTRRIPAVFIESSVPERNIQAVQEACRARGWDVVIGGELFSDAMGDADTPAGTYPGMVRHNVDTIVTALTASATDPARENVDE